MKNSGFYIGIFSLLLFGAYAGAQEFAILESDKVHFDGKQLIFKEGVLLESELGKISAERAEISVEEGFKFSEMRLEGNVLISLKENGQVQCDKATINGSDFVAAFSAGEKFSKVTYSSLSSNGKQGAIRAKTLALRFLPKEIKGAGSAGNFIREAHADGEVEIHYDDLFTATSDHADYRPEELFVLRGNVKANFRDFGTLTTEKDLFLKRDSAKGGTLEYIKCVGETFLRCENEEKNLDRNVHCYGEVFLDNAKRRARFTSPHNDEGAVEDSRQLFFQENVMKIRANEAIIDYDVEENGRIVPSQITLKDNVRLINREGALLQYALADQVEFSPISQEIIFKAFGKKRALFYDKVNNLQTSAPELRIKRDKTTKKESIKGVGDVRFHFVEKEFEQLRKRFLLEKAVL